MPRRLLPCRRSPKNTVFGNGSGFRGRLEIRDSNGEGIGGSGSGRTGRADKPPVTPTPTVPFYQYLSCHFTNDLGLPFNQARVCTGRMNYLLTAPIISRYLLI